MSTIAASVESLNQQLRDARARYDALVQKVARGEEVAEDDFLILAAIHKSPEEFQTDCADAAAIEADHRAAAEAGRLSSDLLPAAQEQRQAAAATYDQTCKIGHAISVALVGRVQEQTRTAGRYWFHLNSEIDRLRSGPNRRALSGRRAKIARLKREIADDGSAMVHLDPTVERSNRMMLESKRRELETLEQKPLNYMTTANVPPSPAAHDPLLEFPLEIVSIAMANGVTKETLLQFVDNMKSEIETR